MCRLSGLVLLSGRVAMKPLGYLQDLAYDASHSQE